MHPSIHGFVRFEKRIFPFFDTKCAGGDLAGAEKTGILKKRTPGVSPDADGRA